MSFAQLMRILRARFLLVVGGTALGLALGLAITLALPKRYDATASVMVEPKTADVLSANNAPQNTSERIDNVISTNIDIMTSPNVALKVVDALKLESNPRARDLLVGSTPMGQVREWGQRALALILPDDDEEEGAPVSVRDWMADRLLGNARLKANRDSRIVRLTYSSPDPQFSATVANAWVKAYRATLLELQVGPAKENTEWLEQQAQELKRNLEQAETRLAKFAQEKGIVATDERLDVETSRLADLSGQLAAAQSLSYESQARQRHLRQYLAGGGEAPAEVATSPVVQQLKGAVAEREAKLSELSKKIGPNHPQYISAATELEKLRGQLSTEVRNAAQSMLASQAVNPQREGALQGALSAQRGKVLRMKSDRNELATMMREVDTAQKAYTAATQRMSQTSMESQLSQTNGAIVDAAVTPRRPASPNTQLILLVALAAGALVGIGLALYSETVNRLVRSEHDIVELLGLPVLIVLSPKKLGPQRFASLPKPGGYALPSP